SCSGADVLTCVSERAAASLSPPSRPGSTRESSPMPAGGRHPQDAAAGAAAPSPHDGPPSPLPDWLDRVPQVNRPQLLAMRPEERALTLSTIARFYGFDTR